jgi:hypothetical protein
MMLFALVVALLGAALFYRSKQVRRRVAERRARRANVNERHAAIWDEVTATQRSR